MTDRQLTPKEVKGQPDEEIPDRATSGQASNSHIYRHIGH
jgi:hypothetical protein